MGENSAIEWCDHTFNPWVGCEKIAPACDNCYAETWARRTGQAHLWAGERRRTSEANWREPIKWDRKAKAEGVRRRVFCASLADVFDNQISPEWRADLWTLIGSTPNLDWLLLTKRPQNIAKMVPVTDSAAPGYRPWNRRWPWPNVWLGATVEDQARADRNIPALLAVPAIVHFVSAEPLLGPILFGQVSDDRKQTSNWLSGISGTMYSDGPDFDHGTKLDWVIVGGESGPGARPLMPTWARVIRDQCALERVPFLFKQWGDWHPCFNIGGVAYQMAGAAPFDSWKTPVFNPNADAGWNWRRLGKKRAGRVLDGITHDAFPEPRA